MTERFEGDVMLLNLWPQTAEKIVDLQYEVWRTTQKYFHSHGGRRQAGLLKVPVESDSYFWICS